MPPDQVAEALAELRGTVINEIAHTNRRLDSHSAELKELKNGQAEIKAQLDVSAELQKLKDHVCGKQEDAKREEVVEAKRFWRHTWTQVALIVLGFFLSSIAGGWVAAIVCK